MIADLPPSDLPAEIATLGALMCGIECPDCLTRRHFSCTAHEMIFGAIEHLAGLGKPTDSISVAHELERLGLLDEVGGMNYLGQCLEGVPRNPSIEHHVDILAQLATRRELIYASRGIERDAHDLSVPVDELIARADMSQVSNGRDTDLERITAGELASGNFEQEYIFENILAKCQLGIIAGAFKTLKTSVLADMWISAATGHKFLGEFPASPEIVEARGIPAGIISGESGKASLQSIAKRICAHRGIRLADAENLVLSTEIPDIGTAAGRRKLRRFIERDKLKFLGIDPVYRAMPGVGDAAGNLFIVGKYLGPLIELGEETGCSIVINHHCGKRTNSTFEPAELADIQWSGFAEAVRQWILLSRRSKYEADGNGVHQLWMNVGGSAGHSGLWAVDITEGRSDSETGRTWEVDIAYASQARAKAAADARETRDQRRAETQQETAKRERDRIVKALKRFPEGETASGLEPFTGLNSKRFKAAMADLLEDGTVVPWKVHKPNRKKPYPGFKLTQCEPIRHSDNSYPTTCRDDGTTTYTTSAYIGAVGVGVVPEGINRGDAFDDDVSEWSSNGDGDVPF